MGNLFAQKTTLLTDKPSVEFREGNKKPRVWNLNPELNPDILETTESMVTFMSDIDTVKINIDKEWESFDFNIKTQGGETYPTRIIRKPVTVYDNPNPSLMQLSSSGLLSREQAEFDIRALTYTLDQVHPDIFSTCDQAVLMRAVNNAIAGLPDSISKVDLYRKVAPIVALIGDGHTNLVFPTNSFITPDQKRMPMNVDVLTGKSLNCRRCYDSIIPKNSKIISINGIPDEQIIDAMLPFVSGEREHFKLSGIDGSFTVLYRMLFPADEYVVSSERDSGTTRVIFSTQAI